MQNLSEYTLLDGLNETDTIFDLLNETLNTSQVEFSDNSGPSAEALVTEFVFEVILLSVISFFGLIGNIGAIVLFATMKRQLKFHRLMLMLSAFDLFYVILSFMLFALPRLCEGFEDSGAHAIFLPKALPVAQIVLTGSIYTTLAISIERFLIVCHPFYTVSHQWSAMRYMIPILTWSLLYNFPKFFELHTAFDEKAVGHPGQGYVVGASDMRLNEYYIKIYCIWMNFIFMGLIPFVALIILNAQTLWSLQATSGEAGSSTKKNEIALAKVGLTIVLIFILCHSVKWIPNIYELVRLTTNNKRSWPSWVESTTHVAHSLMSLNSSVNFYVYCVKHFRVSCCPAKSSSSNNGMGQVLISTTASGDHNMVNRVNGTTRNLSGVSSRYINSETGVNETIV